MKLPSLIKRIEPGRPAAPPTVSFTRFLRFYLLWGLPIRAGLLALFWIQGEDFLRDVFAISTASFLVALPLMKLRGWNWLFLLYGLECAHLSVRLSVAFGWQSGFHLQLLLLTVATLLVDHYRLRTRIFMALLPIVFFVARFPSLATAEPVLELTWFQTMLLYLGNCLVFITATMLTVIYFIRYMLRQKAQAEALAESRAQLIGNMSHELKTPLAALMTTVQSTLDRERTPQTYREALALCERNTRGMSRLVTRMLDVVSSEGSGITPQWTRAALPELLGEIVESYRDLAAVKEVKVELECAPALAVRTDADLLGIIITNFLANAIRYCREGGKVRIIAESRGGGTWAVSVSDEGPGVASKDYPHIFEPFYRADRARSRREGNVGLGLTIADRLAKVLGGEIQVESAPGEGAVFSFRCRDYTNYLPENLSR